MRNNVSHNFVVTVRSLCVFSIALCAKDLIHCVKQFQRQVLQSVYHCGMRKTRRTLDIYALHSDQLSSLGSITVVIDD